MRGEINYSHKNATEPPRLYALGGVFCFNSSKFYELTEYFFFQGPVISRVNPGDCMLTKREF